MRNSPLAERIEAKSIPEPNSGCWLWLGPVKPTGYGTISIKNKTYNAHRVSYETFRGAVPVGLVLDHKCRLRCCVNPDHLEPVTCQVNLLRGTRRTGLCRRGHFYNPETDYRGADGRRYCRQCKRINGFNHNQKRRGKL